MYRRLLTLAALLAVAAPRAASAQMTHDEWYKATGKTCSTVDVTAAKAAQIKTDKYNASTMISPDSAKLIALCAVPGKIGSGEMNVANGRTEYAIDIVPNKKKTH